MRLLPVLLVCCFVLYEVLQVEGKSKENVVKKLLQKYIHHHKHPHHHNNHPHHHKHHHHHHPHHHHHHHHHHGHPHHKHWHHHHHHHHHHHKSFHQRLVEKLKKEKQQHPDQQNDASQKATKRESLPQLLVSLGKGFMQLGKHLGNNESRADVHAKGTPIKPAPTPKPVVDDAPVATTQAASAFATPSPTSQYYSESDNNDDIGGDALTAAPPTPTASQKVTLSDSLQSNYRGRTVPHSENVDLPIITPTPFSEPSPSPRKGKDKQNPLKPTIMNPTTSRISKTQDSSVQPKMGSDSDKENESATSDKDDRLNKAQGIDEHRDSAKPKIPKIKNEESIPNPSIEIPADQARLLEHSPTESAIDGKEEDEPSNNEQFGTSPTSNENPGPDLYVSESSINNNPRTLPINATQNADAEDDLSSNDETKGSATVNTPESISVAPSSIDNLHGNQAKDSSETKPKADVVDTKSEDSQSKGITDGNLSATASDSFSKDSKTESNSTTTADEIMDGEVPPTEIENDRNSVDDLTSKGTLKSSASAQSIDGDAKPFSQDSDSTTDKTPSKSSNMMQDSEGTALYGTTQWSNQRYDDNQGKQESSGNRDEVSEETVTSDSTADQNIQPANQIHSIEKEPSQQSDSTTDQPKSEATTQSGNTKDELAGEPSQQSDSTNDQPKSEATTQSSSTKDELAGEPSQQSDSTNDQPKSEATTKSGNTKDELAGEPSQQSDSTTDQPKSEATTQSSSTKDELAGEPSQQSDSTTDQPKSEATTQSGNTKDELAEEPSQHSDSTNDGEATPTSPSVISGNGPVPPLNHGHDDITSGVTESLSHYDSEALKDAQISTPGTNSTVGGTDLATPNSEANDATSDLDDDKTGKGVKILRVRSRQDSKSYQDAPQPNLVSNSTLEAGNSGFPTTSDYATAPEANPQSEGTAGLAASQSNGQQSDDVAGGALHQAPVYQTETTLDGQEHDDTKGNVAQLLDVPVDEAFNPTGEHLNQEDQKINQEEHQDKSTSSEIEDGEVLPSTDNTVTPNTEGFNSYNWNVPAIYN